MTTPHRFEVFAALAGFALLVAAASVIGSCAASSTNSPGNGNGGSLDAGAGLGGFSAGQGGSTAAGTGGRVGTDGGTTDASSDAGAGTGGRGGGSGLGGSSGSGGAIGGCIVRVNMVSPPDPLMLEAFPGARARVSAAVTGARISPASFTWTVIWNNQLGNPLVTKAVPMSDATSSTVEFPVENVGTYVITPTLVGQSGCQSISTQAVAQRAVFVLRATASSGFPAQEVLIALPSTGSALPTTALNPGMPAPVQPIDTSPARQSLPAYVRVTSSSSSIEVEGDTATLAALLPRFIPSVSYDVLIVPVGNLAPLLISGTPATWTAPNYPVVNSGIPVAATVRDGANHALQGARMILRRGSLPSTVGTSDVTGAMTLLARAGTVTAFVVPPDGSGLPPANVGTDGAVGIAVDESNAVALDMVWDALPTARFSVEVHAPDGTTRVAGAQVRATARGTPAKVGTLTVRRGGSSPMALSAVGGTDILVVTDAGGVATFPPLPLGDLTLSVIPPATADGAGSAVAVTTMPVTLTAAGLAQTVKQASKVTLSGMLLPASASAGALVTAIDNSVTAPGRVATATVAGDGSYSLPVDPSRSYQLIADLPAGAPVSRALLGTIATGSGDTTVPARTLPQGQVVTGKLISSIATDPPVSSARVQIFCPSWSAQCLNPNFALADVVTNQYGEFRLGLPAPTAPAGP